MSGKSLRPECKPRGWGYCKSFKTGLHVYLFIKQVINMKNKLATNMDDGINFMHQMVVGVE